MTIQSALKAKEKKLVKTKALQWAMNLSVPVDVHPATQDSTVKLLTYAH
jgi:hypothetical protein